MRASNALRCRSLWLSGAGAWLCLHLWVAIAAEQTVAEKAPGVAVGPKSFASAALAADALVDAASKFDVSSLKRIFGPRGDGVFLSGELPQDQRHAADFARAAHEKRNISVDPANPNRTFLIVGRGNWPFPVPIVKRGDQWVFDAEAGLQELLHRRIGANELDAIGICRGYVEAQHEYAMQKREGYAINQYAQRIISTPGKRDGLAWQNAGAWAGPVGEKIARAIEAGYTSRATPYHGYFFKILKGQGPPAPLGELDFVVKGLMIGGFALVAGPAEYGVTGVQTFLVSHDGVVYEKDFGPASLKEFRKMERFNPDGSWTAVRE